MDLNYALVKFNDIDMKTRDGAKLRGYFAQEYEEDDIMHNHKGNNFIFTYPKIQYKVINNTPFICGIAEGANVAAKIGIDTDQISIQSNELITYEKEVIKHKVEFGLYKDYIEYKLLTPWMALNQNNIRIYRNSGNIEKEEMLKKILIGNILSMSKGVEYTVKDIIHAWIDLQEISVKFKNIDMVAFKGRLKINFDIPDYLGIGKAVSRGFGTVMKV